MLRLAFLHGFLGDKEDWTPVAGHLKDFDCQALDYPFEIPAGAIVVGYSMGGRIALRLPHPKIIIAAHVGDCPENRAVEDHWIDLLKTLSFEEFLEKWYDQPLFASLKNHPNFPLARRRAQDPKTALLQIESHRLSEQPLLLPTNAQYIHGEKDKKYSDLYNLHFLNPIAVPRSGHACHLENPEACASAIRECVERLQNIHRH